MLDEKSIPRVVEDIRQRLIRSGRERMGTEIGIDDVAFEDGWLFVYARPTTSQYRVLDYTETLRDIETELRREGIEGVILMTHLAKMD